MIASIPGAILRLWLVMKAILVMLIGVVRGLYGDNVCVIEVGL